MGGGVGVGVGVEWWSGKGEWGGAEEGQRDRERIVEKRRGVERSGVERSGVEMSEVECCGVLDLCHLREPSGDSKIRPQFSKKYKVKFLHEPV
jgi:hypothetical protein